MQQPTPNYDKDDTGSNITNRSAKFYNGTYAWCDEGYEDEKGVFHRWGDENDPDADPPTPMYFRSGSEDGDADEGDESGEEGGDKSEEEDLRKDSFVPLLDTAMLSQTTPVTHSRLKFSYVGVPRLPQGKEPVVPKGMSPLLVNNKLLVPESGRFRKTVPRTDLFEDVDEYTRQRLMGRLEGMLIGQWHAGPPGLSLKEAYAQVGVDYPDQILEAEFRSWLSLKKGKGKSSVDTSALYNEFINHDAVGPKSGYATQGAITNAGEPASSPTFSWISGGLSDVSDPPSEMSDPDDEAYEEARKDVDPAGMMFIKMVNSQNRKGARAQPQPATKNLPTRKSARLKQQVDDGTGQ